MAQLPLNIVPRRPYSPDNFFVHRGVAELVQGLNSLLSLSSFRLAFVEGGPRSGKTHLSIYLSELLSRRGLFPRFIEGSSLEGFIQERILAEEKDDGEIILVDDAERFLDDRNGSKRGQIVSFIEKLRVDRSAVVFFSSKSVEESSFDDHTRSRLSSGVYRLGDPDRDEMDKLIGLIAAQRGIQLSSRKRQYLSKRLSNSVSMIDRYFDRVESLSAVRGGSYDMSLLSQALG